MRKILSVAMLIVGTMIGAGFCSGRELVSFFGSGISVFVAPLCGVCIFFVCVLFLYIGTKIR
ncbi:MAG: transporter, partial [Clostridiales bacterium]|nr:transporter [Clostridiales bacterium]